MLHGDEGNRFQLWLVDREQDDSKLLEKVFESISSYQEDVNYQELMVPEVKDFYTVYHDSLLYVGQFGFGVKNFEGSQKMMVKTNIEEMVEGLEMLGYSVSKGKILIENRLNREMIVESEENTFYDEDENSKEKGPVLSKKLGEMPTSNSSGFVNYFNLALFLTVDVFAILIGLYLLMR